MKEIYYPEFELESAGLLSCVNHAINVKLLLLVCDRVIFPASHILRTNTIGLASLKNLRDFIESGKVVPSIYTHSKNLNEHYLEKIDGSFNINRKLLADQASYICKVLFANPSTQYHLREYNDQLFLFHKTFIDYLIEDKDINAKTNYSKIINGFLDEIESHCERTGQLITYDELLQVRHSYYVKSGKSIHHTHKERIEKVLGRAYFFCGAMTLNSTISYNKFLDSINFKLDSKNTNYPSSLIVSPDFLANLLLKMSVIDNLDDLLLLKSADYDLIKSHPIWNEFINHYYSICEKISDVDTFIESQVQISQRIEKRKIFWNRFGIALANFAVAIPSTILFSNPTTGVIASLGTSVASFGFEGITGGLIRDRVTDRIINRLLHIREPLYVFVETLKQEIDKCKEI